MHAGQHMLVFLSMHTSSPLPVGCRITPHRCNTHTHTTRVQASVEPVLEQFKPPFISRIYFKDFTFGGAPIELDNVWVDPKTRDKVILEVDMRWSAETANIALAVDMLGSSDLTRLVVRVQDVALSGTARITFQPLIDEYPGFGAMTVALMGAATERH